MLGLIGAFWLHTDIARLLFCKFGQLCANTPKVELGDLLIQMFRQDIDLIVVSRRIAEQFHLRQNLVGKACRHHEGRVPRSIAKVQQAAFGQKNDAITRGHLDHIHLFLDIRPLVVPKVCHLNFIVEMADVADNRHVLHLAHMLDADHVLVARGRDEDIGVEASRPDRTTSNPSIAA